MLIVLWSTRTIKSLSPLKNKVARWSCVIYERKCSCNLRYIGETKRNWSSLESTRRSTWEFRTGKELNRKRFSQDYLESIVGCAFILSSKENPGSAFYCTKEACIEWSLRASLFVFASSWYYLRVTLPILCHNYWFIYCLLNCVILLSLLTLLIYIILIFDSYHRNEKVTI